MIEEFDLDLGSMPSDWSVSDIQNETLFVTDYVANGSFASLAENVNYKNEPDYAVLIRLTDFNNDFKGDFVYVDEHAYNFLAKSKLVGGEIIISNVGAYAGTTFLAPRLNRPMTLGPNAIMMNFKSGNAFYFYWFKSPVGKFLLDGIISGSAQPKFNKTTFRQLKVPVPPIEEQKAIASVLSSLDDKIDLLHRQNTTLERMAETLFRQWFVEEAQEDWEQHKLGDCVTISYGKNLPTKNLLEDGFPVFGANGQIGFYDRYTYDEPQVLVSCRGEASGKVNISLPKSYITNNSLVLERNKMLEISFEFLKYWALSYDFDLHVSGSAQPQITIEGLYDADFTLPSKDLIEKFTEMVKGLETKKLNNFFQIQTLEKLRDNLLPKLMSGEVRVS